MGSRYRQNKAARKHKKSKSNSKCHASTRCKHRSRCNELHFLYNYHRYVMNRRQSSTHTPRQDDTSYTYTPRPAEGKYMGPPYTGWFCLLHLAVYVYGDPHSKMLRMCVKQMHVTMVDRCLHSDFSAGSSHYTTRLIQF